MGDSYGEQLTGSGSEVRLSELVTGRSRLGSIPAEGSEIFSSLKIAWLPPNFLFGFPFPHSHKLQKFKKFLCISTTGKFI